jgi:hypothetical protein
MGALLNLRRVKARFMCWLHDHAWSCDLQHPRAPIQEPNRIRRKILPQTRIADVLRFLGDCAFEAGGAAHTQDVAVARLLCGGVVWSVHS